MNESPLTSVPTINAENPVIITANRHLGGIRLRNFYITNAFQGFVWMIFHFSMVFFFTFQLQSVFLVGIFLGIANLIAFFLDIPIGILQRYFSTKKLFIIGATSQLIATLIFFNFIYEFFTQVGDISTIIIPKGFESIIGWFFGDLINWALILIASLCYGLTKEINDISTFGYILSNASPSEYSIILARNNITYGIGSLTGLVLSGMILSLSPTIAVIILACVILLFLYFTSRFFDNSKESVGVEDIVSFTIAVKSLSKENIREYLSEKINIQELPKIIESVKYIFLKPLSHEKLVFNKNEFIVECKKTALVIWKILTHIPRHIIIYWTISLVLIFGFWDTFAATFLLDYLDNIKPGWSYILLACIALPALGLQEFSGKLAQKIGIKTVAFAGLGLSGGSLIIMGLLSGHVSDGAIIFLAVINSIGYACGMSLGQNGFLENYNRIYAASSGLNEIDANAAAGPMKILQNFANVVGLMLGGAILGLFGYSGFFILFGLIIIGTLVWSIVKKDTLDI